MKYLITILILAFSCSLSAQGNDFDILKKEAIEACEAHDWEDGVKYGSEALALNNEDTTLLYITAKAYIQHAYITSQEKLYHKADDFLTKLIDQYPAVYKYQYLRGMCRMQIAESSYYSNSGTKDEMIEKYNLAKLDFEKALKLTRNKNVSKVNMKLEKINQKIDGIRFE